MSRPRRSRKIFRPPLIGGYLPYGSSKDNGESVSLLFEEYEAIRLADYEGLPQQDAAFRMGISRPTFSRVYDMARQKIAKAIVEGLPFKIDGGSVYFSELWYKCDHCNTSFSTAVENEPENCPVCRSVDFRKITFQYADNESGILPKPAVHHTGFCECSRCGLRISHQAGNPCRSLICPYCSTPMIREHHPVED
ncbi:MAG: DUF134 domain-containing protein [Lentimicrobium sp.]|jgi:predicted DNA-binding protein (UPF0251 family)/DNA-directed RNA polymerase subunit RPC12/RpoP|nr:DUF134 domain-containing protein [Lentimicrobium sp.]